MKRFSVVVAVIAVVSRLLPWCFGAEPSQPSRAIPHALDVLIPKNQQQEMGLQKLTDEERELLARYMIARFIDVRNGTACSMQQASPPQWRPANRPVPQPAQLPPAGAPKNYTATGGGHWIRTNIERGAFIRLEDGSLWEVDGLDKVDSSLWLPVDNMIVMPGSGGSPGYNYLLINTNDRHKVHAKYLGKE